jgi:cysteine synthase A
MTPHFPPYNFYLNSLAPTPLVCVQLQPDDPPVWAKLEFLNPSGSTKDRIARYILEKAWREGRLRPGCAVIEASSGSTSIAMALACAQLGLRFIAVMPAGVSPERVQMIRGFGGETRLIAEGGIAEAVRETERLAAELDGFLPRQFSNPDNALAHQHGTAREILDQIPGGAVDAVVSGVGTGGTLVGLYQGCREGGCPARPVLARPVQIAHAPEIECCSFSSRIPGVMDCASSIFQPSSMPDLIRLEIRDEEALAMTRRLIAAGFPVGPSSGLNFAAALEAARIHLPPGAAVVTVFPDRMERYFSTGLFSSAQ